MLGAVAAHLSACVCCGNRVTGISGLRRDEASLTNSQSQQFVSLVTLCEIPKRGGCFIV